MFTRRQFFGAAAALAVGSSAPVRDAAAAGGGWQTSTTTLRAVNWPLVNTMVLSTDEFERAFDRLATSVEALAATLNSKRALDHRSGARFPKCNA